MKLSMVSPDKKSTDQVATNPPAKTSADGADGRSRRIAFLVIALVVTLAVGVLNRTMSQQWGRAEEYQRAARLLENLPAEFGPWRAVEKKELGRSAMELLQCQGYTYQTFRHNETGDLVQLAVLVGPGAKMSVHVPEICFEATNYRLVQDRERVQVSDGEREDFFWRVRFQMNDVTRRQIDVLYGWYSDGGWLAPQYPRWSVAGVPVLFKLQLLSPVSDPWKTSDQTSGSFTDSIGNDFLKQFLPILNSELETPHVRSSSASADEGVAIQ